MSYFKDVCEFNRAACTEVDTGTDLAVSVSAKAGITLIAEEFCELADAIDEDDPVETVDAIADLVYVALGLAYRLGVDMDPIWQVVHESNMQKLAGGVIRNGAGKICKPAGWSPPDIAGELAKQGIR